MLDKHANYFTREEIFHTEWEVEWIKLIIVMP